MHVYIQVPAWGRRDTVSVTVCVQYHPSYRMAGNAVNSWQWSTFSWLLCTNWQKFCHWNLNIRGPVWNHHQLWENLENLPADSLPTLYSKSLLSDSLETFPFSSEIKFSWNWKHETSWSPIPGASALQEWEHDVYAAWSECENDPKTRH